MLIQCIYVLDKYQEAITFHWYIVILILHVVHTCVSNSTCILYKTYRSMFNIFDIECVLGKRPLFTKVNHYHCNSFIIYNNEGNIYYF